MAMVREPVQMVRLTEKRCSRTFGVAPCGATGAPCYNTDATCTFRAALDLSETLAVDFVSDDAHPWNDAAGAYQPALAIPALRGYDTAPTVLNVAGGSDDRSAVGQRAVCNVRIADFPWNDRGQDPYPLSRASDPMARGTYWTKWMARQPFHTGYMLEVFEGYRGQPLDAMTRRVFEVEKIAQDRQGVSITARDPLSRITDAKVTIPPVSPGELASDLSASATALTVAGASASDYPHSGYVRIGSEVIAYAAQEAGAGGVTLTGLSRGALQTEAAEHSRTTRVQRVVAYEGVRCDAVLADMLFTFGGIDPALHDAAAWDAETGVWRPEYIMRFYITEPTDLRAAVGQVLTQCLMDLWWDERTPEIRLRAQRPQATVPVLSEDGHIVADSLTVEEVTEQQATRVTVFFAPRSWVASLTETSNYARAVQWVDLLKEQQYGKVRERIVFAPGIRTIALAGNLSATLAARFRDVQLRAKFEQAREDESWTGDLVRLLHFLRTDADGLPEERQFVLISAEGDQASGRWRFTAQNAEMVGRLWAWVGDEVSDFAAATSEERAATGYWTDDDGRLPDGSKTQYGWL